MREVGDHLASFLFAALGGIVLFALDHNKRIDSAMIMIQGVAAVIAFVLGAVSARR